MLEASELAFSYETVEVVRDVSFKLERGQFVGLIGANGCGKSTLLKLLAGVLAPDRGSIRLEDAELAEVAPRARAKMLGYVPQQQTRVFPFTVLEVVLTGRSPYTSRFRFENARDRDIALQALSDVGAEHLAERAITELSGGEQQMVSVARALAQEASVLLLDEPAASLDLKHRAKLLGALARLREQRELSALVVTHDLQMLDASFDVLIAMRCGELLARGPASEVLEPAVLCEVFDDPNVRAHRFEGRTFVWSQS